MTTAASISVRHPINLPVLLETRLLVQANSGGGKSWVLRRLLEQTAASVQQLVIDPEGEFATLREKFDYVIAAPHDADAIASPQTAALLARRLLESGVSAILNIYDLKAHERILFVRRFLDALVNAPKSLWHPVLVVLDEAHVFCPQVGSAESAGSVIDIATRGRKRGFCPVLATQRIAKLHKDAAAEMNNKLIGRTVLDVDVKRAAEELGMTMREAWTQLRGLPAGEFFAFGPALGTVGVEKIISGPVTTTHPKPGERMMQAPPAASSRVLAQLAKLADLQKEAEHEARTVEELKAENAKLKREAAIANKRAEQAGVPEADVQRRIAEALKAAQRENAPAAPNADEIVLVRARLQSIREIADGTLNALGNVKLTKTAAASISADRSQVSQIARAAPVRQPAGNGSLPSGERAVLIAIAQHEAGVTREQLSILTGYKRSTRDAYLQRMRERGLVAIGSNIITATTDGIAALGTDYEPLPTGAALREHWLARLPEGEARILALVCDAYPQSAARDGLSEATGYARSSRDAYIQRLKARQLVHADRDGVKANRTLFD